MKKIITIVIVTTLLLSICSSTFAGTIENELLTSKYTIDQILEAAKMLEANEKGETIYTEEFIQKYGIASSDKDGNDTILIPIGKDDIEIIQPNVKVVHDEYEVHVKLPELPSALEDSEAGTRHYDPLYHVHRIENSNTYQWNESVGLTQWAAEGFTVTKSYNESGTLSVSVSLGGGITIDICEAHFGYSLGGSYTVGAGESYSKVVPAGYDGRISYYAKCHYFDFDTYTDYYYQGVFLYTDIASSYAISEPYEGVIYLELRDSIL